MLQLCVCRDIEQLGSLESTQEARVARGALMPLSCSPNFPRVQYLDIRTLTHELIVNFKKDKVYFGIWWISIAFPPHNIVSRLVFPAILSIFLKKIVVTDARRRLCVGGLKGSMCTEHENKLGGTTEEIWNREFEVVSFWLQMTLNWQRKKSRHSLIPFAAWSERAGFEYKKKKGSDHKSRKRRTKRGKGKNYICIFFFYKNSNRKNKSKQSCVF